ncbi:50S ribosomal protein L15e [archaeon]|nr:50S ribosomal protein L15e [archaeon]
MYKYIRNLWKSPNTALLKARIIKWRKEDSIVKLEKPTNLTRARSLGYKAKQGYILTRVRVPRGGRMRPQIKKGRRSKHSRHTKVVSKSYQTVAEERAQKKYKNLEVLNSYNLAKDGKYYWVEVILVDPNHPVIKSDKKINWIGKQKNRVSRGLTSSAKKSRGLHRKGLGSEKTRPSQKANKRRAR